MNIKDLKEAIKELMVEKVDWNQFAIDTADDISYATSKDFWIKLSSTEKKVLKLVGQYAAKGQAKDSFAKTVAIAAAKVGADLGDWPDRKKAWRGDIKFDEAQAKNWICNAIETGKQKTNVGGIKSKGKCPESWGADISAAPADHVGGGSSTTGKGWWNRLDKIESQVLARMKAKILNDEYSNIDFATAAEQAASELGINTRSLRFMQSPDTLAKAKDELMDTLPRSERSSLSEAKGKKRGFGEGEPPDEEIYKKREVVQEIDAETPDVAKELGDASKEQGEATMGVADAHTRGAEAAKQRQDASKAWKDAKITQVKAVDAAEKHADQEAKAMDAQAKAMDAAQKAAEAAEKASGEKEKMLDIAKQAHEQEKEAADVAQEAAKAEEEAASELADTNTTAAEAGEERSEIEGEFGDAITADEEARGEEAEEAEAEKEETKKDEEEVDKKEKEDQRKKEDEKQAEDAEAKEEEAEAEDTGEDDEAGAMTEMLKAMVREVLSERKWGDDTKDAPTPQAKLKAAGITADELRSMVLQTVMHGEEERDMEMIKLLKDMLGSLQSIEYHTTPEKGSSSQLAQAVAKGWVSEGKNREVLANIPSLISEMRRLGMNAEADDYESFFRWASDGNDLTMQEIKNEADAQIDDLQKMLRKMGDHVTGKEDSLEKQKLRGEVPGHH